MSAMGLKSRLTDLLFPPNCPFCGGRTEKAGALCGECRGLFRLECAETCPECGKSAAFCRCGCGFHETIRTPLAGERLTVLTFYHSRNRFGVTDRMTERMLYRLKETGEFADFFADELSSLIRSRMERSGERLSDWRITYPPRSTGKREHLGFDHSGEVALRIGKRLGIPAETVFYRAESGEQKYLNAEERLRQAQETLLPIREKITPGGKYLLFDDIITTGATVETAARNLYFCGASAVHLVAIAHSICNQPASDCR